MERRDAILIEGMRRWEKSFRVAEGHSFPFIFQTVIKKNCFKKNQKLV